MPRDPEDARNRLRRAAIELFAQHGFDQTTAAQIAARAGVTERTFFRHFPDKREVLFDSQNLLGEALAKGVAAAGAELSPMATLRLALNSVVPTLEGLRPYSEPRQRIIAATPALQEREVAKHAALVRLMGEALQRRGVAQRQARLAADVGLAVFGHALNGWFAAPGSHLQDHLDRGFAELQELTG